MTDRELIVKKLAVVETAVQQLRTIARPEILADDIREQRFVEHTLQIAIQAALDAASHIVSDRRLGEPASNREMFDLLCRDGWIDDNLRRALSALAGFRNILVHGYAEVDVEIVRDVVEHRLDDLLHYVESLRSRL